MLVGALAAVAGFAMLFSLWWRSGWGDGYAVLRIASQEFVEGRAIVAGELAESVDLQPARGALALSVEDPQLDEGPLSAFEKEARRKARQAEEKRQNWLGLREFLIGVGRVAKANQSEDLRERRRELYDAIPYLESASEKGFPEGRVALGTRILAESLYQVGRYDEAIPLLKQAMDLDPTQRRNLLPMLAESQLNALAPFKRRALETIGDYLEQPTLSPQQRWDAQLVQLRAMIALEMWEQARDLIAQRLHTDRVPDDSLQDAWTDYHDQVRLLTSIVDVREATVRYGRRARTDREVQQKVIDDLQDAIDRLKDLQRESPPRVAAQARLWSARAYLAQGRIEDALTALDAVRLQRPLRAEGIVGGLQAIELLAEDGRGVETLHALNYLLRELGDSKGFDASLITFDEFQRRTVGAIEQLRRKGEYRSAIDAARSLAPVFDLVEALTQEGIGFREWAESTIAEGTDISGQVARNAAITARARFRAAGDAFVKAADLRFNTDDFVSTQWAAIEAYQEGRHFEQSIRLLRTYLQYESRAKLPRGLVAYGRALLAEDQPDPAIEAFETCIVEYPRDPLRYDARLLSALAHAEKGDLQNARELLEDNLNDGDLTPKSPAWQDSLLTLGELLYQRSYRNHLLADQSPASEKVDRLRDNQPLLEEAIRRLDEAAERYWAIPRGRSASYLSARARVMASKLPRLESQSDEILEAARRTLRHKSEQNLVAALDRFTRLRRYLDEQTEEQSLPSSEHSVLRNCLLAEADVMREMSRLEDAAAAYRAVELRYMNEPPALEAILGRATCARRLGRTHEANLLIRQASVVLERIPNELDDRFAETTRYDRNGWQQFLGWMNQRLAGSGA